MGLISIMSIIWGIVVTSMAGLLIYNATCCTCRRRRDLQTDNEIEKSRREIVLDRARRINPFIRAFGSLSALMTAGLVGIASWMALETLIR